MSRLKARIRKLQKGIGKRGKMPVTLQVVYQGDGRGDERAKKKEKEYYAQHGTLDGLIVIHSNVAEPSPVPAKYRLKETDG